MVASGSGELMWNRWQGDLLRKAYLLSRPTAMGWHALSNDHCIHCHQHRSALSELCPDFLLAIPSATAEAHDAVLELDTLF